MTEKEKMQQQMLYDANYDTELIRERQVAKDLCYQFNQLRPSDETHQQQILSTRRHFTKSQDWRQEWKIAAGDAGGQNIRDHKKRE